MKFFQGKIFKIVLVVIMLFPSSLTGISAANALGFSLLPDTVSYSAKLTNAAGVSVITSQDIRFSLWTTGAALNSDYLPDHTINTLSPNYAGWFEVHTVIPDINGIFHLQLGDISALPNIISSTSAYLEVEIKPTGMPDTAYEILKPSLTSDRFVFSSSLYTINADTLDNANSGTASGNIPVLDADAHLPISTIPGGTNTSLFILDFGDSQNTPTGITRLQFGSSLAKLLEYDNAKQWFNFNDNVNVTGNLTVTGTLNGMPIGPYRQGIVLNPFFPGSVLSSDGTNNFGKMEIIPVGSGSEINTLYKWTTRQTTLSDKDVIIKVTLPEGFTEFTEDPFEFSIKTLTSSLDDNRVDIEMLDTANNPVSLNWASGLASSSLTNYPLTYLGTPVFTPGQDITIIIKLSATNLGAASIGRIKLNFFSR